MLERAREQVAGLGYAAGWGVVKQAPKGMTSRAFQAVADAATVRNGSATRQLRKNLRRVVGPNVSELRMDQLVGDALRSYSRYWLETFRLPKMDVRDVADRADMNTVGREHIEAALDAGKGAVLALPHQGNWDVAGVWLVANHGPFATVAERLKPDSLFDRFVAYRESLGFEVLPLTGGARPPLEVLTERLRQNKVVCLLADRDLSRNGVEVDFFGEPTRMPAGPSMLAATTGAALLPISLWFTDDDGWGQRINAPVVLPEARLREQVRSGTQSVADSFARDIAEHPADWHMLQRLWLADLPPRREASG
ncbi:phosphatidylinositol mannoside acyltransferase [Jatrophihabitans sp.]|uniref:phosphatidylinositol mannoside acyltransferase n=1 Tax=Jatrophihabitans sp. TaxID=1932789 RepID=UPI0030C6EFEA|nr:KDO2-lipid lauroyltransferase [Jatrophihabitans sp.]